MSKFKDILRYFGILILTTLLYAGVVIAGLFIWPDLVPVWTVISVAGCALIFPYALWLDRRMMK